jgi:hypothetical protein
MPSYAEGQDDRLMPRFALILEFGALFIVLPLAYRFSPVRFPALPLFTDDCDRGHFDATVRVRSFDPSQVSESKPGAPKLIRWISALEMAVEWRLHAQGLKA